MTTILLRRPTVQNITGFPRSTLYNYIAEGLFPSPVRLGKRAVAWPEDEVEAINAARIAGKSDDEIRTLVAKLHKARQSAINGETT